MNAFFYREKIVEGLRDMNVAGEEAARTLLRETSNSPTVSPRMFVFSALALLAFGDLDHLDRALELLSKDSSLSHEAPVRPFLGTLVHIIRGNFQLMRMILVKCGCGFGRINVACVGMSSWANLYCRPINKNTQGEQNVLGFLLTRVIFT